MDFDDLLLNTEELFERFPEVRFAEATRFDHLLIDEYQDTNGLQYRIVKALAERHRNLCVVGDDDQSIYGWRGAEVTHILSFSRDWPDAKVVRLEDNYRSRAPIIELANTLIVHNPKRHDKRLRAYRGDGEPPRFVRFEDETKEAESVVREIKQRIDSDNPASASPRATSPSCSAPTSSPGPSRWSCARKVSPISSSGGQSFYDRKEIRDVLSYLRVLANPSDEVSLLRIINTPPRGIGASSVQAVLDVAVARGEPLWNALPVASSDGCIADHVAQRIEAFRSLIDAFRARLGREPLAEVVRDLVITIDYKSELDRAYKNAGDVEARWASIEELVNAVALYEQREEQPSLLGFLEESTLGGRDDQRDCREGQAAAARGHADDAAQRERSGVPARIHGRHGGRASCRTSAR